MIHFYEAYNENVFLRPLDRKDIESLRKWRNNPINKKFLKEIPYITPKMQKEWFQCYLSNDDEISFAIIETKCLMRLVGSCSLYNFSEKSCFFGKILVGDETSHGQKIGLNATIAAVRIAFDSLGMNEVKLLVYSDNVKAINIYKKANFVIIDKNETSNGKIEYTMIRHKENKNDR